MRPRTIVTLSAAVLVVAGGLAGGTVTDPAYDAYRELHGRLGLSRAAAAADYSAPGMGAKTSRLELGRIEGEPFRMV